MSRHGCVALKAQQTVICTLITVVTRRAQRVHLQQNAHARGNMRVANCRHVVIGYAGSVECCTDWTMIDVRYAQTAN